MMGLADRVEAWARRFGIPPPAGVDAGAQRSDEAQAAPSHATDRGARGEADDDERFAREVRNEG